jgi:recombinational DNA repair protein (RecF pathway)
MREYVSRAVVLSKETRGGHADARYSFFTERYGKIAARAKSSRKIVSKLAGHLEPGTLASVRVIETYGVQVIDALKIARVDVPIGHLASLNDLLPEWEPDVALWSELGQPVFSWTNTLAILGWDPRGAVCAICGRGDAPHFFTPRQEFFCTSCASKFRPNQLLLVDDKL